MPANPHKSRCLIPGCSAWAMRRHTLCRSHRDAQLGPRGAGAPPGNLNALKTGDRAHPLAAPDLHQLAHDLVGHPDQRVLLLERALDSVYARTGDSLRTLLALQALLADLIPLVAGYTFTVELAAFLASLAPALRARTAHIVLKHALVYPPEQRLLFLRGLVAQLTIVSGKNLPPEKTIDGNPLTNHTPFP